MDSRNELTAKIAQTEDITWDHALRPRTLDEYVGQKQMKDNLRIFMTAAKQRGEPLEHCLFVSPPGLGKTTLAHIIGQEMGANVRVTSGPSIERAGDLAAIVTNLEPGDVLFIDEIHGLPRTVEEILYPCLEDGVMDLVIGKGPGARTVQLPLPPFTMIGATTRLSLVSAPLRDRFGHHFRLGYYSSEELAQILERSARLLNMGIHQDAVEVLASRSRGTPRIANRLLRRVRDFAQVAEHAVILSDMANHALAQMDIDGQGLDHVDREILSVIIDQFQGGPVGLSTIAAATSEEVATIEEVIEPYLLQKGFLARTARGRVATKLAYEHLHRVMPMQMPSLI